VTTPTEPTLPLGLRVARAVAFASAALVLALGAHVLGGGALPGPFVLLVSTLPLACASVVLARRVRGLVPLAAVLATAQLLLHETFAVTASASGCADAMPAGAHASHAGPAITCANGAMAGMAHAGMAHGGGLASVAMLVAHGAAVLATALLLARGERLVRRVLGLLLPRLVRPAAAVAPVAQHLARAATGVLVAAVAVSDLSRRGPPTRTAATTLA